MAPSQAATPLISLERVSRLFDNGALTALSDVDLRIEPGERVAITGPSGSGKSSLISLMSGIDQPTSGQVRWRGEPVGSRRAWSALRATEITVVFQEFNLLPTLTAAENVEMALFGRGLSSRERGERARAALETVGLAHRSTHLPTRLSGGERQRVAIARSLVIGPTLLLADEPTGNLDRANAALIAELLFEQSCAHGSALVLVTHDEALAARCPRVVRLEDGRVIAGSGADPGDGEQAA